MIKVGIVDDHPVYRKGLAHAVESAADLELGPEVPSVEELDTSDLDLVILDLGLPGMHGPAAVEHLVTHDTKVLVVSAQGSERDVLDAISAGASGYMTKSAEPHEILDALRSVAAGDTYVSPTLAGFLLRAAREDLRGEPWTLTEREKDVLGLLAEGQTDRDIADRLGISVRTVQSHLDRIRDKTGHRRRADLTRLALERGLTHRMRTTPSPAGRSD